ncbi:unnamed protein product [Parajaminaea phylloscopi]
MHRNDVPKSSMAPTPRLALETQRARPPASYDQLNPSPSGHRAPHAPAMKRKAEGHPQPHLSPQRREVFVSIPFASSLSAAMGQSPSKTARSRADDGSLHERAAAGPSSHSSLGSWESRQLDSYGSPGDRDTAWAANNSLDRLHQPQQRPAFTSSLDGALSVSHNFAASKPTDSFRSSFKQVKNGGPQDNPAEHDVRNFRDLNRTQSRLPPKSPASAHSGPESPDPLNCISPKRFTTTPRQASPTPSGSHRMLPRTLSLSGTRTVSGLEQAMGNGMRPVDSQNTKRKDMASERGDESGTPLQKNRKSPTKPAKRPKQAAGPSPIRTDRFYQPVKGSQQSAASMNPTVVSDHPQAAVKKERKVQQSSKAQTASKTPRAGGARSEPIEISDDPSDTDTRKSSKAPKRRRSRHLDSPPRATSFTAKLRLALPASSDYASDSAEEWDKLVNLDAVSPPPSHQRIPVADGDAAMESHRSPSPEGEPAADQVRSSVIKAASRASPARRLLDLLEDLLEAEGNLPDAEGRLDESVELPPAAADFYVIVDQVAVIRPAKLQQLSRLIRICASKASHPRRKQAHQHNVDCEKEGPSSLADIDVVELQKLVRLLQPTIKIGEGIEPFHVRQAANETKSSPTKPKSAGRGGPSPSRRRSSASAPLDEESERRNESDVEEDKDELHEEDGDEMDHLERSSREPGHDPRFVEPGTSPSDRPSAEAAPRKTKVKGKKGGRRAPTDSVEDADLGQQQEGLSDQLSRIATSLMAVESCLSLLSSEHVSQTLRSEDILKPCLDLLRAVLDGVIFPYVEACTNVGATPPHPLLEAWLAALVPEARSKRGRRSKKEAKLHELALEASDPRGIFRGCSEYLANIFRNSCTLMDLTRRLAQLPALSLSESMIFTTVYAGIGPFFVAEPTTLTGSSDAAKNSMRGRKGMNLLAPGLGDGGAALKSLRQSALALLHNIFARHPDQRQWIVEEILTSLGKLPDMNKNRSRYHLRNGRSINSISALLLQLIQSAASGIGDRIRETDTSPPASPSAGGAVATATSSRPREQMSASASAADEGEQSAEDSTDFSYRGSPGRDYDLGALRKALEPSGQVSKAIAIFLMNKVGQAKVVKSSGEFSYSSVIETLVGDLIETVFQPEWPASGLLLSSLCRSFNAILEDPRTSPDAKGVALEHTGTIAAHLRASQLRTESLRITSDQRKSGVRPTPISLSVIERNRDKRALSDLNAAYIATLGYLSGADANDQVSRSAIDLVISIWGTELSSCLIRVSAALDDARDAEEPSVRATVPQVELFLSALHQSSLQISQQAERLLGNHTAANGNVFGMRLTDTYEAISAVCEQLVHTTSHLVTFDFMRAMLVDSLHGQAVGNRTKALRSLHAVYDVDPELLTSASVREHVETRLSDESTAVREAAVGLLSLYLLRQPDDINSIYERLAERIYDSGLAVRKRILKLLASIFRTLPSRAMRVDACIRMVRCVNDEDVGIQELAVQTLSEIWLGVNSVPTSHTSPSKNRAIAGGASDDAQDEAREAQREEGDISRDDSISIILSVTASIREKPSPVEEVFRRFNKNRSESEMQVILEKLRLISDFLIAALSADEEGAGDSAADDALVVTHVKALYLVVSTNPAVMTIGKAKALLLHLKGGHQTADRAMTCELILKIYRISLPLMPMTALAFARQLEATIRPWFNSPPTHSGALQEFIHCYATIVRSHTNDWATLIRTFGQLIKALRKVRERVQKQPCSPVDIKTNFVMSQSALLTEKVDFDALVKERADLKDAIMAGCGADDRSSVRDVVFKLFLDIRQFSACYAATALRDIGYLFRGFPLLMIQDEGMQVMNSVFAANQSAETERLLRIMLDFLDSDVEQRAPEKAEAAAAVAAVRERALPRKGPASNSVDMSELVGNTSTFADSGVSSVLVQRYLEPILRAAVNVKAPSVQRPALDIVKFVVTQGLTHPLQCVPTLICLETLEDRSITMKALKLHEHLFTKHASILASRYAELVRSTFEFQLQVQKDNLQMMRGYRIDPSSGCPAALLDSWYTLLRDRRQTRLDFVKAMTKLLDIDTSSNECSEHTVLLSRFVADNLATLHYKTLEEVLVVAAEIKRIISITGAQVKFFAEELVAAAENGGQSPNRPHGGIEVLIPLRRPSGTVSEALTEAASSEAEEQPMDTTSDGAEDPSSDEDAESVPDKATPSRGHADTARMSIAMGTAVLLRTHLKHLYGLSEGRCAKFQVGKKQSSGADRPALKKDAASAALSFDAMPLAIDSMAPRSTALEQLATYEDMLDAEGALADDPDDWEE